MTGHLRSLAFVRNKAYASAPERAGHRRIAAVPFTLRNFKEDLEDVGSRFDGAPDLEFRLATGALELEKSGLSYQSVPPTNRWRAGATRAGAWRAQESTRRLFRAGRCRVPAIEPGGRNSMRAGFSIKNVTGAACRRVHRRREPRLGLQRPAPDGPRSAGFFFTRARLAALPSAPRRV
jgi:hypothetical protein